MLLKSVKHAKLHNENIAINMYGIDMFISKTALWVVGLRFIK